MRSVSMEKASSLALLGQDCDPLKEVLLNLQLHSLAKIQMALNYGNPFSNCQQC